MALCVRTSVDHGGVVCNSSRRPTCAVPVAYGRREVGRRAPEVVTCARNAASRGATGARGLAREGRPRGDVGVVCRSSAAQITALTAIDYGFLGFGALILILIGAYSSRTTDPMDMMNIAESSPEEIESKAKEAMAERMKQAAMGVPSPGDGSAPDKPVMPGSKAEFDALKPGTWFYYPETGKVYQKPEDKT